MRSADSKTRSILRAASAAAIGLAAVIHAPAHASLVRVDLGIYGGRAIDLAAYAGSGGATRIVAAVDGDIGGVRLNDAGTRWQGIFFGRPGALAEVEADITDSGVGSGAGVVYALRPDGQLLRNDSEVAGPWTRAAWTTVTGGGVFYGLLGVSEAITTILGHASGTYVGTASGNVYRSTDGGITWTLLATPAGAVSVDSIAAYVDDPANPTLWVVLDTAGTPALYELNYAGSYSATGPVTVTGSGGVFERVFVYPSTSIPEAPLLFVTGNSPSQSVYRGENDGASWSTVTEPFRYFQEMRFDAANDRIHAVGGVSTDRGISFTQMPNLSRAEGSIHPNDGTSAIDPNDASRVYIASDWFVGEYTESAGSWTAAGEVVDAAGVTAVLIDDMHQIPDTASTKETFVIGGKTGIGITSDFVTHAGPHPTWTYPIFPMDDGSEVTATRLQDYDGDGVIIERVFAGNRGGKLYKSTTQGLTAASYSRPFDVAVDAAGYYVDSNRVSINDIAESTTSMDDLWIAFGDWDFGNVAGGIACSTDNGDTWTMDPAWVSSGHSMSVNALLYTNTRFWAGVGKQGDLDPSHAGIYTKTGALAGCGAGTWSQQVTGTDIDTSIVYDLDGTTSSLIYVAASSGLFRGELSGSWSYQELTGSLDPELAELPSGPGDVYDAVTFNPAPAGYDEEIYAATGDQIYRIRRSGSTWTVDLISPTPHEDVRVLLWDALVVGSSGGVSALGAVGKAQDVCLAAVAKARTGYIRNVTKAMVTCRSGYVAGGPSCPDDRASEAIAKAQARMALGARCSDVVVQQLSESWPGSCFGVQTVEDLEACNLAEAQEAVAMAISAEYGAEDPDRVGVAVACQGAIGRAFGGFLAKAVKTRDKCERNVARARATSCPDASTASSVEAALAKAAGSIESRCSDGDVVALDGLGFGGSCSGASTVAELQECLSADHETILEEIFAQPQDSF